MGKNTFHVAMSLFRHNRERLCCNLMKETTPPSPNSYVLLEGGQQETRYSSDTDIVFRQVGYQLFFYLFHEYYNVGMNDLYHKHVEIWFFMDALTLSPILKHGLILLVLILA